MPNGNYTIKNSDGTLQFVGHTEAWQNTTEAIYAADDAKQKQKIMSEYLQGIRGEIDTSRMAEENLGDYAKACKDVYTNAERKKQVSKKGTQLWQKSKNAAAIEKQAEARKKKMVERADKALKSTNYNYSAAHPAIIALSAFMKGSSRSNAGLLRSYVEGHKDQVLTECINEFMTLDLSSLDLKSDKKTADNAEALEKLSERFSAIQYLVTTSSDVYQNLPEKLRISFENYYGKANTVVTQYRLKKLVMTDNYYRTHENREIGTDLAGKMTASQRNLAEMIWQYKGGLAVFLNKAKDYYRNGTLKGLMAALRRDGVGKDRLDIQERLRKRREELEKRGLAARMDDFILRERNLNVKGSLGVIGHARNLTALNLTGDPENDLTLLPEILDQREVIDKAVQMKKDSQNTYYMEQSDHQISVAEASLKMLPCIRRIEQDLLIIGRLTKGGSIDTGVTSEMIEICRMRYAQDLAEYKDKMAFLNTLRNSRPALQPEESPEKAVYAEETDEITGKVTDPVTSAKKLISDLTSDKFSDYSLYLNREKICALSNKCKGTEVSDVLEILSKKAVSLWKAKRLLNVNALLKGDKNNASLKSEAEKLKPPEKDDTFEAMMKLLAEAEKKQFDFQDMKAIASHYTRQYDWAVTSQGDGGRGIFLWVAGIYYKNLNKKHGSDRELVHGEEKYNESVERLQHLPPEITAHQDGTPLLLQKGDTDVPALDITKYFEDPCKDALKAKLGTIKEALAGHENDYPQELRTALEAMEHYVKIKYIVTTETTEMEMAFLDKFQKDMDRAMMKMKTGRFTDPVIKGMFDIMADISTLARGKLRDKDNPNRISDAEFAAAIEQPAINMKFSENDLNESNVKDIPLFTHRPNMNDIKQGNVGDCYFMAAVTAFVQSNPDEVMNMFYDIGDGNVLVRLYMGFDKYNRRVDLEEEMQKDDVTLRPVYIKVRKDYDLNTVSLDCMWVQLLEKAYASTGAQHKTMQVDPVTGELKNFITEITGGLSPKILMHLTGKKDCFSHDKPKPEENPGFLAQSVDEYQMRSILSGVHPNLHYIIWDEIKAIKHEEGEDPDAWENKVLEIVRSKVAESNELKKVQMDEVKEYITKNLPNLPIDEFEKVKKKYFEIFVSDPEAVAERVRKNLHSEKPDIGDGWDLNDPNAVASSLYDVFNDGNTADQIISQFDKKINYYNPASFKGNNEEVEILRKNLEKYAGKKNKAMTEYNPLNRYTTEEMIFLHDVRAAAKRKEGMHFAVPLHVMDILDAQLKNGRWYVLVRDTHNVRNYTYEKNRRGDLVGTAGKVSYDINQSVRRLDGNLNTGFLGTSWWELSTIFDKMVCYGNSPKV